MPEELEFARKHRDRIEALGPAKRDLLLNYLFVKHVKPRLRNQKLTFNEEEIAKTSFKRSFMRERGAQLPKDFGRRKAPESLGKMVADIGTIAVMPAIIGVSKGTEAIRKLLNPSKAEEIAAYFQAGQREMKKSFRETAGEAKGYVRPAYEFVTEEAGRLLPSAVATGMIAPGLAPLAATGRLGAAVAGAAEGAIGFSTYTGEPESAATGALLGGGLSVALPFIPRAIAGVRSKVSRLRGKPPVVPKAPATELEQALAGEKTKSALLDEISVKRTGKTFAELTEQESSKFGPRIMGEYRASLKTKTAMSPRDRKELAKVVEQGTADIKAIQTGAASAKAVQRRMAHARELKGSKLTELEEMNIRAGMSPLDAISTPGVTVTQATGIPVPKPAAAPPPAPTALAPDVNDVALRAARGAVTKEFPPVKTPIPQTKQVTQATEAGQALKEANNITLTLDERIQAVSAIKPTEEDFFSMAADQIRDKYNTLLRDSVNSVLKTVNKITDAATKRKYQTKLSKAYLGKLEQIESQTFVKGSQKGIGREKMARLRARAKAMEQRLPGGQYGPEIELKLEQLRAAGVEVDELTIMKLQSGTSVDEILEEMGRL